MRTKERRKRTSEPSEANTKPTCLHLSARQTLPTCGTRQRNIRVRVPCPCLRGRLWRRLLIRPVSRVREALSGQSGGVLQRAKGRGRVCKGRKEGRATDLEVRSVSLRSSLESERVKRSHVRPSDVDPVAFSMSGDDGAYDRFLSCWDVLIDQGRQRQSLPGVQMPR